jgi:hypothetical protein
MSEMDLELLQERALIEGLPYQTLMSSVLHKYVTGRLTDKNRYQFKCTLIAKSGAPFFFSDDFGH